MKGYDRTHSCDVTKKGGMKERKQFMNNDDLSTADVHFLNKLHEASREREE